jgi:predicted secreted protein
MATVLGKAGYLRISSLTVLQLRGFTLNHTSDTVEDTVIGDEYKTRKATLKDWRVSGDLYFDTADTGANALTIGSTVTVDLYPMGIATASRYYQGQAIITSFDPNARHDGMVEVPFSAEGTGALSTLTV